MRSTFVKLFARVLVGVQRKILQLKVQNGRFGVFFEKNGLSPSEVKLLADGNEDFWIGSILHHCKCFGANEDIIDWKWFSLLQLFGKDRKTMDGECSPSLDMLKEVEVQ
jgi:hypothetical protein